MCKLICFSSYRHFLFCRVTQNIKWYISPYSGSWSPSSLPHDYTPPPRVCRVETRPAVVQRTLLSSDIWNCYVRTKTSEITIHQASWYLTARSSRLSGPIMDLLLWNGGTGRAGCEDGNPEFRVINCSLIKLLRLWGILKSKATTFWPEKSPCILIITHLWRHNVFFILF